MVDITVQDPINGIVEIGGPEKLGMDKFGKIYMDMKQDKRQVISDLKALYFRRIINDKSLVPADNARKGSISYQEWIRFPRNSKVKIVKYVERIRPPLRTVLSTLPKTDTILKTSIMKNIISTTSDNSLALIASLPLGFTIFSSPRSKAFRVVWWLWLFSINELFHRTGTSPKRGGVLPNRSILISHSLFLIFLPLINTKAINAPTKAIAALICITLL